MPEITAEMIKKLKNRTMDISITECKKILEEANGDNYTALHLLSKKGVKIKTIVPSMETIERDKLKYFKDFDFSDFWDNSFPEKYVEEIPSDKLIISIEEELGGYKLPASYVELMKIQNGGHLKKNCFPTNEPTRWAKDHCSIICIMGIGRIKQYSLCGDLGSNFMKKEWGYPDIGICFGHCPSAGHDMIMLDYRECGKSGEPRVVHVDQECDYRITFLANKFESFVKGLMSQDNFNLDE